jgi:hypothetical protein
MWQLYTFTPSTQIHNNCKGTVQLRCKGTGAVMAGFLRERDSAGMTTAAQD